MGGPQRYQVCDTVLGKRTRTPFPTKLDLRSYSPAGELGQGQFKAVKIMESPSTGSPRYAYYGVNDISNEINLLELPEIDPRKKYTIARFMMQLF